MNGRSGWEGGGNGSRETPGRPRGSRATLEGGVGGRGEALALVSAARRHELGPGHHVHAVQQHRGRGRTKRWKKIVSLSEDQLDCCLGSLDGLARDKTEAEKKVGALRNDCTASSF